MAGVQIAKPVTAKTPHALRQEALRLARQAAALRNNLARRKAMARQPAAGLELAGSADVPDVEALSVNPSADPALAPDPAQD